MERTHPLIQNILSSFIADSEIHGKGLFSEKNCDVGEVVGSLDGQIVNVAEHPEALSGEWNGIGENHVLYRKFSTYYSYINHDNDPNLTIDALTMKVIVQRKITALDELTLNYRENGIPDIYNSKDYGSYLNEK